MAKSLRSKVKQRFRRAKRHHIEKTIHTERINALNEKVAKIQQGLTINAVRPKNAFLYPNDPDAVFAQKEICTPIDFRSENLPLSGYATTGSRRTFTDEEKLKLGLIVRSKDGLLESEKRELDTVRLKAKQKKLYDNNDMELDDAELNNKFSHDALQSVDSQQPIDKADSDDLVFTIKSMKLRGSDEAIPEFSLNATNYQVPTIHDLKAHQDKVGGRKAKNVVIPQVKNRLKNTKKNKL